MQFGSPNIGTLDSNSLKKSSTGHSISLLVGRREKTTVAIVQMYRHGRRFHFQGETVQGQRVLAKAFTGLHKERTTQNKTQTSKHRFLQTVRIRLDETTSILASIIYVFQPSPWYHTQAEPTSSSMQCSIYSPFNNSSSILRLNSTEHLFQEPLQQPLHPISHPHGRHAIPVIDLSEQLRDFA